MALSDVKKLADYAIQNESTLDNASMEYDSGCSSYYGRKRTTRYRAHDNACPVCDEPYRGLVAWGQTGRSQISGRTSADLVVRQEPE